MGLLPNYTFALSTGQTVTVAAADRALVEQHRWHERPTQWTTYVQASVPRPNGRSTSVLLHRLLCNAKPGQVVDHRNGDGLDNRRANLRLCTQSQNLGNMRLSSRNTSGFKGVYFERSRGLWRVDIWLNNRKRTLGRFQDRFDAARAYNVAALEQWGEFARLNEVPAFAAPLFTDEEAK